MGLPKRSIRLGNETKSGYFDEQDHLLYQCDAEGKLTGKVLSVKPAANTPPPPPPPVRKEEPANEGEDNGEGKSPIQKILGKVPKPALVAGCALILVAAAAVAVLPTFMGGTSIDDPNIPMIEDPSVVEEVSVIRTVRTMIPGQQISMADLAEVKIDGKTYQQFAMFDRDLCQWGKADQLVGGYVSEYMPAGHYIELQDIVSRAPITTTPWVSIPGTKVPVALDELALTDRNVSFGSKVDMTVHKVVNNQVAAGTGTEGEGAADSTIDAITRTEEYNLTQLTVVDMLNADGQSIFSTYTAYAGIPLSERLDYISTMMREDPSLEARLTPVKVILNVDDAQAATLSYIGSLENENVDTAIRGTTQTEESTSEMSQCIADFVGVRQSIQSAIAYNEQLAAEEQAALQEALEAAKQNQENG